MVLLDYHAAAQQCDPAACVKAITKVTHTTQLVTSSDVAKVAKSVSTQKAGLICDPSDCPPACRDICDPDCCAKSSAMTQQVKQSKQMMEVVRPVEKLVHRVSRVRPSGVLVGAD